MGQGSGHSQAVVRPHWRAQPHLGGAPASALVAVLPGRPAHMGGATQMRGMRVRSTTVLAILWLQVQLGVWLRRRERIASLDAGFESPVPQACASSMTPQGAPLTLYVCAFLWLSDDTQAKRSSASVHHHQQLLWKRLTRSWHASCDAWRRGRASP